MKEASRWWRYGVVSISLVGLGMLLWRIANHHTQAEKEADLQQKMESDAVAGWSNEGNPN